MSRFILLKNSLSVSREVFIRSLQFSCSGKKSCSLPCLFLLHSTCSLQMCPDLGTSTSTLPLSLCLLSSVLPGVPAASPRPPSAGPHVSQCRLFPCLSVYAAPLLSTFPWCVAILTVVWVFPVPSVVRACPPLSPVSSVTHLLAHSLQQGLLPIHAHAITHCPASPCTCCSLCLELFHPSCK